MPRSERPLEAGDNVLLRFANDLRLLRRRAGGPTYRLLAEQTHYSVAALAEAAAGRKLPTLAVTLAYVRACAGDAAEWERRWHEVAAQLAAHAGKGPPASGDEPPPYVGLAAFQASDASRFFGRERLVQDLLTRLGRQRFVAVVGASGAGKSSILRAGLLPRWQGERPGQPVVLFTPGPRPLEECAIALSRLVGVLPGPLSTELRDNPSGLHHLARRQLAEQPDERDLLVVVDQLEEIFTLCQDVGERHRFIELLLGAVRAPNSRCRVVMGVRADFYAHCTAFPDLVQVFDGGQVIVGPMTADELRRAIVQPAVGSGYTVETALLTSLVADVNGQSGVLPLVSHALLETWRRRRGNALTLAGFQAAGGIVGALAQTAESVYARLSERRQQVTKDLMLRLTAPGDGTQDTKRRAVRSELADDADTTTVLDRMVEARLVTLDRDTVEITHEALIRSWPRLREWLAEDREGLRLHRDITVATDVWESLDRDRGALYRGVRLARAQEWAARRGGALTGRERRFLAASVAADDAERRVARRRSRRLRQAVALLSGLLVLAVAATAFAVRAQQTVVRQRDVALSQIVAGKAAAMRRENAALAAQLSLAAYRLEPTAEARTSLLGVLPYPYARHVSGHTDHINFVTFSPDGQTLLTASHDHTARVWDVSDPARPVPSAVLSGHRDNVNGAAFGPDGSLAATASWDHKAMLWDVTDPSRPSRLATLTAHTDDINAVAFSPDGHTLATASSDRTVKLWDVNDPRHPRLLRTLAGHTDAVVTAAFRPDGGMLATAGYDRRIMLWDPTGRQAPKALPGLPDPVTSAAFSPDGTRLASVQGTAAAVWEVANGRQVGTLDGHDGTVRSVVFGPDGRTVATAGEDKTARLWSLSAGRGYRQVAVLEAHAGWATSVAFSPDGKTVATGSDDTTAVLWKVPSPWPDRIDPAEIGSWVCDAVDTPISEEQWTAYFPGVTYRPPCQR